MSAEKDRDAHGRDGDLPRFVSLSGEYDQEITEAELPLYAGAKHGSFTPRGEGVKNLSVQATVNLSRLNDRRQLLRAMDDVRRGIDKAGEMGAFDAYQAQAYDMITSRRGVPVKAKAVNHYKAAGSEYFYVRNKAFWDWQAFLRRVGWLKRVFRSFPCRSARGIIIAAAQMTALSSKAIARCCRRMMPLSPRCSPIIMSPAWIKMCALSYGGNLAEPARQQNRRS